MANIDKNIIITPSIGSTNTDPKIDFFGASSTVGPSTISLKIYPLNSGTLSFEASAGQLFSIVNNLTSGSIFSVNDTSGIPSIDVNADGTIVFGPYGGNTGVGTTSPTSKFTVQGNALVSGILTCTNLTINSNLVVNGNALVSGVVTCTDLNTTSDAKFKTNIQTLNNSIEILKQINPVSFNWKSTGEKSYGVIAQELEKILPELVKGSEDEKSVNYIPLIALLIDAILELDKKIEN